MWTVLTLLLVAAAAPVAAESNAADGVASGRPEFLCPLDCVCKTNESVDCRGAGIRNISHFLRHQPVIKLDLSHNDISHLGPSTLTALADLEDLNLAGNPLTSIDIEAFRHARLKSLSLQSTHLGHIPPRLFAHLPNLHTLRLDLNEMEELDPLSLQGLPSLRHLRLDVNRLQCVPQQALSHLKHLEILNLSFNKIRSLPAGIFGNLTSLVALALDYNDIETIDDAAFQGLESLKILELRHNQIKQLPNHLQTPLLHELFLSNNHLTDVRAGLLQQVPRLTFLELRGNPLQTVDREAFAFLPRLQKLILSEVKDLRHFPSLNGSTSLELIRIDRAKIRSLPTDLCQFVPHLRSLDVKSNMIENLPDFSRCRNLRLLDMSHNRISYLPDRVFEHLVHLHDLLLSHNSIKNISENALAGLAKLKILDLGDNLIDNIHPDAFLPLAEVQDVNMGHNRFATFPSVGLENALHIKVHNNPNLREFPTPAAFPRVQTLALSYAYHCCPFQNPSVYASVLNGISDDGSLRDSVIFPASDQDIDLTAWAKGETMFVDSNPLWTNLSHQWANIAALANSANLSESEIEKLLSAAPNINMPPGSAGILFGAGSGPDGNAAILKRRNVVSCIPEPSPFMPCQDLFDWWSLRCGVWLVFLMALLGNGAVVFVLIFARSKMDVPRFLVCNLGMADFFMGIYLGFLAVVDASTLGEFRMYAIPWQFSAGCQVAGFFGVLSSELSVYTLAVITMERNYAITHAMHLNKRLSLRHASYIMAIGWFFALIMALLPLVGVSDYRKFAVCLPFEVGNSVSKGYVIFLMFINGVAFLILMGCYLKMYCAIRGSQAWNSNDSRIAKRMALLVFTDFLCWAPIAFFSLTAAFGVQFVSLEEAKVFTVFILPLNSCCNPFLYAILTKQFKKDCVMICKAIEESRVTRGIGRCRHSSNFSNRPTPGNTNSVGDRNSSKDGSSCQCQSRLLEKPRRRTAARWFRSPIRTLLRRVRAVENDLDSSSSANEYAYQIAEIQQKQQRKHRRAESVSSDNFSSSRSDSVKAIGCGLPMRMVGRRRNSWTVTRKPSSDSNLSSSRNDSSASAMTASTSIGTTAWRTSRSSVSSDGGSSIKGSIKFKDRLPAVMVKAEAAHPHLTAEGQRRSSSIRDKSMRQLPTSPLAAGILRQQSVATPAGNLVHRTVTQQAHPTNQPTVVVSNENPAGTKAKPRLTRQIAIQDEVSAPAKSVSFDPSAMQKAAESASYCPLHTSKKAPQLLQGVWESSIEEDDEYGSGRQSPADPEEEASSRHRLYQAVVAIYTNRDKNRLGLAGFIPRKLSTISSRSCSVNPDNATDDAEATMDEAEASGPSPTAPPEAQASGGNQQASNCEFLNEQSTSRSQQRQRLLSKSDNDLYCHRHSPAGSGNRPSNVGSVNYLPSIRLLPFSPLDRNSSFEMIDDDVFHDRPQHDSSAIPGARPNQPSESCDQHVPEKEPLLN